VGGAVVGNAGAHGGDMAGNLIVAEILHREQLSIRDDLDRASYLLEEWSVERMEYGYRTSCLKCKPHSAIVLAALLRLERSTQQEVQQKTEEFVAKRKSTQPPGASMGSMFMNPPGDYAGRLIEAAGLKGACIGSAEISKMHANFFINHGSATAADIWDLIQLARKTVDEKFDVTLELEIELIGEW
jgi:UDP-N-acetylmuramate dehydrogenase